MAEFFPAKLELVSEYTCVPGGEMLTAKSFERSNRLDAVLYNDKYIPYETSVAYVRRKGTLA